MYFLCFEYSFKTTLLFVLLTYFKSTNKTNTLIFFSRQRKTKKPAHQMLLVIHDPL